MKIKTIMKKIYAFFAVRKDVILHLGVDICVIVLIVMIKQKLVVKMIALYAERQLIIH